MLENIYIQLVKWYYMIPKIKFHFKNIIRFEKCDSREVEWYFQRKQYGFDERSMWNFGSNLNYKIQKDLNIKLSYSINESSYVTLTQFLEWFKNDIGGVKWLYKRAYFYLVAYDCPTFWNTDNNYETGADQEKIKTELIRILEPDSHADDKEIEFLYKHIFDLGW